MAPSIARDRFTRFKKEGLLNAQTAADHRAATLAPGAREEEKLVERFLGRAPSDAAYKAVLRGSAVSPAEGRVELCHALRARRGHVTHEHEDVHLAGVDSSGAYCVPYAATAALAGDHASRSRDTGDGSAGSAGPPAPSSSGVTSGATLAARSLEIPGRFSVSMRGRGH